MVSGGGPRTRSSARLAALTGKTPEGMRKMQTSFVLPAEVLNLIASFYLDCCPHERHINPLLFPVSKCEHVVIFSLVCKTWRQAMRPHALETLRMVVGGGNSRKLASHVDCLVQADQATDMRHVRNFGVFFEGPMLHGMSESGDTSASLKGVVEKLGSVRKLELSFLANGWEDPDRLFDAFESIRKLTHLSVATKYFDANEFDLIHSSLRIVEAARPDRLHLVGGTEVAEGLVVQDHHLSRLALVRCLVLCLTRVDLARDRPLEDSQVEELMIMDKGVPLEEAVKLIRCFSPSLKRCLMEFSFDETTSIQPLTDLPNLRDARVAGYNAEDGELDALGCIDMILELLSNTKLQTPLIVCPREQLLSVMERLTEWFRAHPTSFAHLAGIRLCPPDRSSPRTCPFNAKEEPAWQQLCDVADDCCFIVQAYDAMHTCSALKLTKNEAAWRAKIMRIGPSLFEC